HGAYDYITKPFDPDEVLRTASRAVEVRQLSHEMEQLRARAQTVWDGEDAGLIGRHPTMRELFKLIGKVAPSEAAVLLHDYPGNVRELENLIQRAVVLKRGPLITSDDLPTLVGEPSSAQTEHSLRELLTMPLEDATRQLERLLIARALARSQ